MTPCTHKQANHQCGTNARYHLDGCRCDACRDAARTYERKRIGWLVDVRPHPYVDAEPVRQHVQSLVTAGMGLKRVAKLSGVPHGSVSKLIYGTYDPKRPPSVRVRRETADRLLAVEPDVSDGCRVDGAEAREIVAELLARGWTKKAIGKRIDARQSTALRNGGMQVQAGTLRALRRLLAEPTPLRIHSPTGKLYRPNPTHKPLFIDPSTPGVPPDRATLLEWDRQRLWQAVRIARRAA